MSIKIPGIRESLTIKDIHRIINRCDVVKDASLSPPSINVSNKGPGSVFGKAADELFGIKINGKQFDGSKTVLDSVKKSVLDGKFQDGSLGGNPESIVSNKMDKALKNQLKRDLRAGDLEAGNLIEKSLPETYQFAFHDSGDTPGLIQAGAEQILTPGSYIDPAGRVKDGIRAPNSGSTDLSQYGFDGLKLEWKWLPDDKCQLTIRMGNIEHTEIRNREHNHVGQPPDYFGGNNEKNAWFNFVSDPRNVSSTKHLQRDKIKNFATLYNQPSGNKIAQDAKKYILCKELGDTTQATFAKDLLRKSGSGYTSTNSCLFTVDTVLAARCKLLEVPCCVKDHSKVVETKTEEKFRRLLFFRPIGDPAEIKRSRNILAINEAIKHNRAAKFAITKILTEGFSVGSEKMPRKELDKYKYIQDYFRSIQDTIDDVVEVLSGMLENQTTIARPEEDIRQIVAYLRINEVFKVKRSKSGDTSYQLIATLRNLFLSDTTPFYEKEIASKFGTRQNRTTNIFQGAFMGPKIDILDNFRNKIINRKTIFEQISFLKSPPKNIDTIIQGTLVSGGWQITPHRSKSSLKTTPKTTPKTPHPPPKTILKKGGNLTQDKFSEQYRNDYEPDTLDFLWLLFKNLHINTTIMREYYTSSSVEENRTNYIEDFAFFMNPYFRFLGETCYDIEKLQWFHDTYYAANDIPQFTSIISNYVSRVIKPRELELVKNQEVVLSSNQNLFLKKFGLDSEHINKINDIMNKYFMTEKTASPSPSPMKTDERSEQSRVPEFLSPSKKPQFLLSTKWSSNKKSRKTATQKRRLGMKTARTTKKRRSITPTTTSSQQTKRPKIDLGLTNIF